MQNKGFIIAASLLKGRAKFIAESKTDSNLQFGYIITVLIDSLDVSKVPEKYREQRLEKIGSVDVTVMPIEQVVYEAHFEFTLKDKDGFDLLSLTSQAHNIYSDKENKFQATIENRVPINIANRTTGVVFNISVDKCVTCR